MIRGFAVLIQSMVLGLRTLNYSINVSMKDLEEKEKPKKAKKESSAVPGGLIDDPWRCGGRPAVYSDPALAYELAAGLYPRHSQLGGLSTWSTA